jgi:hypothetical protein
MKNNQSGNVIFFILLGILLLGLLTAALRSSGIEGSKIDGETMSIAVSQMKDQANAIERGVAFIIQNGASESDIRFAHADAPAGYGNDPTVGARFQLFSREGGGVEYLPAPTGINDGSPWEFFGNTHLPQVGTAAPELITVLPNLSPEACSLINRQEGYTGTPTDDGGNAQSAGCLYSDSSMRFGSNGLFSDPAGNTVQEASFSVKPSTSGCAVCADGSRHYFRVLLAR